jgi:hypothetical protein
MSKAAGTTQAWPICSRVLAGLLGGYVFTYALTAALAQLLPLDRVDALLIASLLSFTVYTLALLWAFAVRSVWRAWVVVPAAAPLALIGFWPHLLERLA